MSERVLKLSLPTLYFWLAMFYVLFHLWLNILAELTTFADREFYKVRAGRGGAGRGGPGRGGAGGRAGSLCWWVGGAGCGRPWQLGYRRGGLASR